MRGLRGVRVPGMVAWVRRPSPGAGRSCTLSEQARSPTRRQGSSSTTGGKSSKCWACWACWARQRESLGWSVSGWFGYATAKFENKACSSRLSGLPKPPSPSSIRRRPSYLRLWHRMRYDWLAVSRRLYLTHRWVSVHRGGRREGTLRGANDKVRVHPKLPRIRNCPAGTVCGKCLTLGRLRCAVPDTENPL